LQEATGVGMAGAFDQSERPGRHSGIPLAWEYAGQHLFAQIQHPFQMRVPANPTFLYRAIHS
jgi:hypothetical protein